MEKETRAHQRFRRELIQMSMLAVGLSAVMVALYFFDQQYDLIGPASSWLYSLLVE